MTAFLIVAALLVAAVIAILLPPLWRAPRFSGGADQREANLAILPRPARRTRTRAPRRHARRSRFRAGKSELQRRLLDEVPRRPRRRPPRRWPPDRAGPAGAHPAGRCCRLRAARRAARARPAAATGAHRSRTDRGDARRPGRKLKKNPDDHQGWVMLARSYKVLERFPEAAEGLRTRRLPWSTRTRPARRLRRSPRQTQGGSLQGKAERTDRTRTADRPQRTAGAAAGRRCGQRPPGVRRRRRVLVAPAGEQVEPGSEEAKPSPPRSARRASIAAAQAGGGGRKTRRQRRRSQWRGDAERQARRHGPARTTCCSSLPAPRKDRACRSPRRAPRVADLPLRFQFDDSMALAGGKKISDFASDQHRGAHRQGRQGAEFERRPLRHARRRQARQPESAPADRSGATVSSSSDQSHPLRLLTDTPT
jgi:cytochrome c-type biogenesis protein CcmI